MEGLIGLLVLLILVVPFAVGIWLIVRAVTTRTQITDLTRRVDELHLELARLKHSQASAEKAAPTNEPAFTAAPLPPRRVAIVPQPAPKPVPTPAPEPPPLPAEIRPPSPLVGPAVEEMVVAATISQPASEAPPLVNEVSAPEPPPIHAPIAPPPLIVKPMPPRAAAPEPVFEPAQAATPPPTPAPPVPEKSSFEMRVGTFWAVRIGIVMLLASLAFFANLAYHNIIPKLGPAGKISLLYLASGLLLGGGAWWQRRNVKESLKNYAQVLFAGGLAAVYFTTYAAHHIPPLQIIHSSLVDGVLLFLWAGLIAWIADRRKSEVMALFAVCLAFFTSVITRVGEFTLYSNLVLTIAAVVFLVRNRWAALSFVSLIMSYVGYAFWRFLHGDDWHWASPDENLWLGAAFLACYWIVFTAATFLSKAKNLSGPNRAAFLTLNNGAYFALFVLTMLQVHSGGFWKFSLSYGAVLLGMAALAKKLLPGEPLTKNSYLTQGLLLVTLGFITKYSGLQLGLVLGMESVVLFVLGTQRRSYVLKFFAYASALLATGGCATDLEPFDSQGLWTAGGLGAMLAFNAFWAHRLESKANPASNRVESSVFTLLSFVSWTAATWFNSVEPHLPLALMLGLESAVFFNLIGGAKAPLPKTIAFISGAAAVGWCAANLRHFDAMGLWTGLTLGTFMLLNTLRAHREQAENLQPLRAEPTAFTLLMFASWLAVTWFNTTRAHLPLVLTAEAVVFTFSIYALRVREITLLGQFFLILGQLAWLLQFWNVTPPWWNPLTIIAVTVGLSHWWQHQKVLIISRNVFTCYSSIFALAAVGMALLWLHPLVSAPMWLVLTSLLAVAVTGYGLITRAWALAIGGQIFLAVSVLEFSRQLHDAKPEWYFPLAPMAVLAAFSLGTMIWFARQKDAAASVRGPLLQLAMIYRWVALAMSLFWIWEYVPERQRGWAYMLAAVAVFALAVWRNSREALTAVAIYAGTSLTLLWLHKGFVMDTYWANLLSLLALFVMQQNLRKIAARLPVDEAVHGAVVLIAGVSVWRFISCWIALATSGFFVTMTWAGYAVVIFAAGLALRERFYRWFGLGVLAAAVGRVVLVDVWRQETLYRVLTFMALGVALLLIGFIYNKYQEKIRQWL